MICNVVTQRLSSVGLVLFLLLVAMARRAVANNEPEPTGNSVRVIAHISLPGTPVRQTFLQEHRGRQYLYIQQAGQHGFTIVDVTKPSRPRVVKQVTFSDHVAKERLRMVGAGLAIAEGTEAKPANLGNGIATTTREALSGTGARRDSRTRFVRLLSLSDPTRPLTLQTFEGVTSILPEDERNLIYITNRAGLWILLHRRDLARQICESESRFSNSGMCSGY